MGPWPGQAGTAPRWRQAVDESLATGERITRLAEDVLARTIGELPAVIGAVLLLLAGWVLAKLLRGLVNRSLALLEAGVARLVGEGRASRLRLTRSSAVLGAIVFWAVLLFFVTTATQLLGLVTFTEWLTRLLVYLPTLIAGLLIVVAGYLLSRFVADVIHSTPGSMAPAQRSVVARAAQVTILAGALLVGADQVGIKVTFLAIFAGAALLAIAGGVVVATSLGARVHVANLIGGHQLRQSYAVGQRIRVAGHEGRILELTAHSAVLETSEGRVSVPGRLFSEEVVVLRTTDADDG